MVTNTPAARLDGRSLGRAWWRVPLAMTGILIVLAYIVAGLCQIKGLAGYEPLLVALGFAGGGMIRGHQFNGRVWSMLGDRAGVQYLPADHTLTRRVAGLAARIGLPAPKVGVMRGMNAYASGPNAQNAVVVIGVPLVQRLKSDELDAVIGHELGHIATGDVRRMQYGEGFQSMFSAVFGVIGRMVSTVAGKVMNDRLNAQLTILGARAFEWLGRHVVGFVGQVVLMASSREREFHADAIGAALTSPTAMITALEKVHNAEAPPTPAEKDFAYMMFRGFGGQLFSTHPTLERRRATLQEGGYIRRLPTVRAPEGQSFAA